MAAREPRTWAWNLSIAIAKPALVAFTKRDWRDVEKIPAQGGVVIAANHLSHIDPFTLAHVLYSRGRLPRFLAKDSIFQIKGVGALMRNAGQIPVARLTTKASHAFSAAVDAVAEGKAVVILPEGTITRDPDLWPMVGRTGAARVALEAGVPVVPIAQWGAQHILYPYTKRPRLLPRKTVRVKVGDPVDLSAFEGQQLTVDVLHRATEEIMAAITRLLEDLRDQPAPTERFDPRKHGVRQIGNPHIDEEER